MKLVKRCWRTTQAALHWRRLMYMRRQLGARKETQHKLHKKATRIRLYETISHTLGGDQRAVPSGCHLLRARVGIHTTKRTLGPLLVYVTIKHPTGLFWSHPWPWNQHYQRINRSASQVIHISKFSQKYQTLTSWGTSLSQIHVDRMTRIENSKQLHQDWLTTTNRRLKSILIVLWICITVLLTLVLKNVLVLFFLWPIPVFIWQVPVVPGSITSIYDQYGHRKSTWR